MAALAHNVLKMVRRLGRGVGPPGPVAPADAIAQDVNCDVADVAAFFAVLSPYSGWIIWWTVHLRRANRLEQSDFKDVIRQATALLNGDGLPPDEADEGRTRLLEGFRWILVDEYQDIGPDEYELISALAGRTLPDEDDKLSIFAVGDDDQNIYAFNGSSTEFIRRFEDDYGARSEYLVDNYRSTGHIIDAANAVIESARQRMKIEHPIAIDRSRRRDPRGGSWTMMDPVGQGRVQILPAGSTPITQARAAVAELQRLSALDPDWDWSRCAVIAREWSYLDPVRSLCELEGIPVQLANEEFTGVWRLRETRALLNWLQERNASLATSDGLNGWADDQPAGPWVDLLREGIDEYLLETGGAETPVEHFTEWLAEWGQGVRRQQRGLLLLTAHRAKGLEFDHVVVLDGGWNRVGQAEDADAPRRLYYMAMTRARETLTLMRLPGVHPFHEALRSDPGVLHREAPVDGHVAPEPELLRRYRRLSLRDVFLGFAGYRDPAHPVHQAIAALNPGDHLQVRMDGDRWELLDGNGVVVGQMARSFTAPPGGSQIHASVLAVVSWDRESTEPEYRQGLRNDAWEVVVPELVFEPGR